MGQRQEGIYCGGHDWDRVGFAAERTPTGIEQDEKESSYLPSDQLIKLTGFFFCGSSTVCTVEIFGCLNTFGNE